MTSRYYVTWSGTLGANGSEKIFVAAQYLRCLAATGAFEISIEDDGSNKGAFGQGLAVRVPGGFTNVRITDTSGASNTIQLAFAESDIEDSRLTLTASISVSPSSTATSSADASLAAAASATIAANPSRKRIHVQASPDNMEPLRVGDSGAGASEGQWLAPGQVRTFDTLAALKVYNPAAFAQSYSVLEET